MKILPLLTALCLTGAGSAQAIVFVDTNNGGAEDGMSWGTAFDTVQEGIAAAVAGGEPEVWVAAGTYTTTSDTNRYATIELKSNITVYGGFAGTETVLSQRNWVANATVLSGNINNGGLATDNAYHVVSCTNGVLGAAIDGFTIQDGYADGPNTGGLGNPGLNSTSAEAIVLGINHGAGGGINNYQAAATVRNCNIRNNYAGKGGGAYNMVSTVAQGDDSDPNPYYENCTFSSNTALRRGGGVENEVGTHPSFVNCRFLDNTCDAKGGGMYNDFYSSPMMVNCVFAGNYAIQAGALGNDGSSSPEIKHCVFANNEAWDKGAAIYNGSHAANAQPNLPSIVNSILYGNTITTAPGPADIETWHDNFPGVTYSIVQEGYAGTGNLDSDPLFADAANDDFALQVNSPAIDAGDDANSHPTDQEYVGRAIDGDQSGSAVVDIGAYEFGWGPLLVTASDQVFRHPELTTKVRIADLLADDTPSPAGGPLVLQSVQTPSSGLASVSVVDDWVLYQPGAGFDQDDTFDYVITDAGGGTANGQVTVTVVTPDNLVVNLTSVEDVGGGQFRMQFRGIPGFIYRVQFATQLIPVPDWIDIGTTTADSLGLYDIIYNQPFSTTYYRTAWP